MKLPTLLLAGLLTTASLHASAVIPTAKIRTNWNESAPEIIWRQNVGIGCSAFALANGKAITLGHTGSNDTVTCLDAASGEVIWTYDYDQPLGDKYYAGGPSATPTIDGNRVYTVSKFGSLNCLDLNTGKLLWAKDYETDFGGRVGGWGWAMPATIDGKLLYIDPGAAKGALVALDKLTGETKWTAGNFEPGYAAPEFYSHNGTRALAVFHAKYLVGYSLENPGEILFKFLWRTTAGVNASQPHYFDNKFFLGSGYGSGFAVIDIAKPEPEIIHRNRELQLQFQNSIIQDNQITATFGGNRDSAELIRLDATTGDILWRQSMPGNRGNTLFLGEHLVSVSEHGHIIVGKATNTGFTELGRAQPLNDTAWAYPIYSDGKLYLRDNKGNAVCLNISE